MNKGFVIMAQNTTTVNYVECAEVLRESILRQMPNSNVTIITELPYGDQCPNSDWKLQNDWQVYDASPYEYTIKLEADMFVPTPIDHWWDILQDKDIAVCSTIRNYKGEVSNVNAYRAFIESNQLPNVYNAITYFRKSERAKYFFDIVRNVFENWSDWMNLLECNFDEVVTTDWAYAIACSIMGEDTVISSSAISMVHMKQLINNLLIEDWTRELLIEYTNPLKVATFPQQYPFHYHVKDFGKTLKKNYG